MKFAQALVETCAVCCRLREVKPKEFSAFMERNSCELFLDLLKRKIHGDFVFE